MCKYIYNLHLLVLLMLKYTTFTSIYSDFEITLTIFPQVVFVW